MGGLWLSSLAWVGKGRRTHIRHLPNFPNAPSRLEGQGLYSAESGAMNLPALSWFCSGMVSSVCPPVDLSLAGLCSLRMFSLGLAIRWGWARAMTQLSCLGKGRPSPYCQTVPQLGAADEQRRWLELQLALPVGAGSAKI